MLLSPSCIVGVLGREEGEGPVWRSRAWWLFVALLAAAITAVIIIAFVTSTPSMSYGGGAPLPPGATRPAAPYPSPHGSQSPVVLHPANG